MLGISFHINTELTLKELLQLRELKPRVGTQITHKLKPLQGQKNDKIPAEFQS